MKILYYDCFSGISGDMNLAAMAALGVTQEYLIGELKKLNLDGYSISFAADQRKGIHGIRADVELTDKNHTHDHIHSHDHAHPHEHQNSEDSFNNLKNNTFTFNGLKTESTHTHVHRNYADIRKIINESSLNENVKKISISIFQKVAEAEAKIHGKTIDEVHFHEVGAVDSIVDIVGAAICIDFLRPDKILSSPVQLGGGFVKCAHGTFPVPAPATLEILKGKPVKLGAVQVETTTPTGAAILAALVDEFTDQPAINITQIAYGIGHRDNPVPNVLRVCLAEQASSPVSMILECNIDDMNPELYEYVMEKLFDAGADDVYFQPIIMKKTRPAIKICVLCQSQLVKNMEAVLLSETSTLGVRRYSVEKTMLQRSIRSIETKWGQVNIKLGFLDGKIIKSKPEYEDCLRLSRENHIPIHEIYREIATRIPSIMNEEIL